MSAKNSGRDVVLQITADKMHDIVLRVARNTAEYSCFEVGNSRVAVWPTSVALSQELKGATANVTANTSLIPTFTQPVSLDELTMAYMTDNILRLRVKAAGPLV